MFGAFSILNLRISGLVFSAIINYTSVLRLMSKKVSRLNLLMKLRLLNVLELIPAGSLTVSDARKSHLKLLRRRLKFP